MRDFDDFVFTYELARSLTTGNDGRDGLPGQDADDVNECMINNGDCEDICINTLSGYYCACSEGTVLEAGPAITCDCKRG